MTDIQKRENDLVAGTFGRGFYVLDNYAPLRTLGSEILDKRAHLFDIKDAIYCMYQQLHWEVVERARRA